MSNMGYCRFQNTVSDMDDCLEHMGDEDLSEAEAEARIRMLKIAKEMVDDYGHLVE